MILSVFGSRSFSDLSLVNKFLTVLLKELRKYNKDLVIVSGGAKGVDAEAEKFADKNSLKKIIHIPDWTLGKQAGILRNTKIVDDGDYSVGFWDGHSKGSLDSINKAKKHNKLLCIIYENGDIKFTEIGKEVLAFIYSGENEPKDEDEL